MFNIENQGANTYLVYKIKENDEIDTLSFGMVANNKIKGVAPALFTQMDEEKYIKYSVSAKIPLSKFFKGEVTKKRFLEIFSEIASAIIAAEDYMIDISTLILNPDYIYVDASTNETTLVCLPLIKNGEIKNLDLQSFFKGIVCETQFDQNENCDYVAKIINYLNGAKVFSVSDFKMLIDNLKSDKESKPTFERPSNVSKRLEPKNARPSAPVKTDFSYDLTGSGLEVQTSVKSAEKKIFQIKLDSEEEKFPPIVPRKIDKKAKKNIDKSRKNQSAKSQNMTLFKLLTNFSKENLELYKAQNVKNSNNTAPTKLNGKKKSVAPKFSIPGRDELKGGIGTLSSDARVLPEPSKATAPTPEQKTSTNNNSLSMPQIALKRLREKPGDFGRTIVKSSNVGDETIVCAQYAKKFPKLKRLRTNETVEINKPRFRIGREKGKMDYVIADNMAIGRNHAEIITDYAGYYIIDMNSTNHTAVNGEVISGDKRVEIKSGDIIRLADEKFEFITS